MKPKQKPACDFIAKRCRNSERVDCLTKNLVEFHAYYRNYRAAGLLWNVTFCQRPIEIRPIDISPFLSTLFVSVLSLCPFSSSLFRLINGYNHLLCISETELSEPCVRKTIKICTKLIIPGNCFSYHIAK